MYLNKTHTTVDVNHSQAHTVEHVDDLKWIQPVSCSQYRFSIFLDLTLHHSSAFYLLPSKEVEAY